MIRKQKTLRGSVLVFTLLVLTILLSVALTSAGVVIVGKNSSRSTEKSALAFQIADGAAENILKRVYKDTDSSLSQLASNLYVSNGDQANCQTGGIITGSLPGASGTYSAELLDINGAPMQCSGAGYNSYGEWRTKLAHIVAAGSYGGATRAIDVTVEPPVCTDATVSYGGDTYDTVQIGKQCWMKQNLRVGTRIGSGTAQANNGASNIEYYCYNDIPGNCTAAHPSQSDGGLYTWDEAMQYVTTEGTQGICPSGWHIPTDGEWYTLENFIDSSINPNTTGFRGTNAGTQLKPGGSSGFEGNLAGVYWSGFGSRDVDGYFWTSTENNVNTAWYRQVQSLLPTINRNNFSKLDVIPVRCIKD